MALSFLYNYTRVQYTAICTYLHLFVTERFHGEQEYLLNVSSSKYVASRAVRENSLLNGL